MTGCAAKRNETSSLGLIPAGRVCVELHGAWRFFPVRCGRIGDEPRAALPVPQNWESRRPARLRRSDFAKNRVPDGCGHGTSERLTAEWDFSGAPPQKRGSQGAAGSRKKTPVYGRSGSGAWTRTRITSSKGWRATNCTTPEQCRKSVAEAPTRAQKFLDTAQMTPRTLRV